MACGMAGTWRHARHMAEQGDAHTFASSEGVVPPAHNRGVRVPHLYRGISTEWREQRSAPEEIPSQQPPGWIHYPGHTHSPRGLNQAVPHTSPLLSSFSPCTAVPSGALLLYLPACHYLLQLTAAVTSLYLFTPSPYTPACHAFATYLLLSLLFSAVTCLHFPHFLLLPLCCPCLHAAWQHCIYLLYTTYFSAIPYPHHLLYIFGWDRVLCFYMDMFRHVYMWFMHTCIIKLLLHCVCVGI